jgi:proline racemase
LKDERVIFVKKLKQINGWIIKEKRLDEVPMGTDDSNRYAVFAKDGRWMEDNLTLAQAEEYCKENK